MESIRWIGRILSGLVILFFAVDGVTHILTIKPVIDAFVKLQIPIETSLPLGVLQICLVILFVIPTTRIIGAILITAYFGGAIAIHVRSGSTLFEILFPVILGLMMWGGLRLYDDRIKAMIT